MKIHSRIYLLSAFFCFLISLVFAYHTIPLFIKWFIPFPSLEQATVYEGNLHIDKIKKLTAAAGAMHLVLQRQVIQ